MQIRVHGNRVDVGDKLRHHVESRADSAFKRLGSWVRRVTVSLDDINGPRGGVCKRCLVVVTTRSIGQIVVRATNTDIFASVSSAIRRAGLSLARKAKELERRRRKRGWRSYQRRCMLDGGVGSGEQDACGD